MRRMSVLMIAVGFMFIFVGCGKTNFLPTGPSEAVASDTGKSAPETGAPVVLSLSPSQVTVSVGDEITIDAVVGSVVDLYGIAATILFESSELQFVRAEEECLIAAQNPTAFMYSSKSDPNKLVIGLSSLGNIPGVTGYGILFRVTFKALSSGQSELRFIETSLRDATNSDIKSELRSATITIR